MSKKKELGDVAHSVHEIEVMKKFATGQDRAREFLERLVKVTAPLVKRRKWSVLMLKEFYPSNPGLLGLNMNRGQSIMVRLRLPGDETQFLEWHNILGTMVHELTHIEIGAHSAEFYELMDVLYTEVEKDEDAISRGLVPDGLGGSLAAAAFEGKSRRLGGKFGRNVDATQRSSAAADAALKRLRFSGMGGVMVLGGAKPLTKEEQREAARRAAERRRGDTVSCGTEKELGDVVIGEPSSSSYSSSASASSSSSSSSTSASSSSSSSASVRAVSSGATSGRNVSAPASGASSSSSSFPEWTCRVCYTVNHGAAPGIVETCSRCTCYRGEGEAEVGGIERDALGRENGKENGGGKAANQNEPFDLCLPCKPKAALKPTGSESGRQTIVSLLSSDEDDDDDDDDDSNAKGGRRGAKMIVADASSDFVSGPATQSGGVFHPMVLSWSCAACTLQNTATDRSCAACGSARGIFAGAVL